jgi:hypothetical protein
MKLEPDLIPRTTFFTNLRSMLRSSEWDRIRKIVYVRSNYRCEICGNQGEKHPVECHEMWNYENGIQKLVGLTALCPSCHEVKHIGLARMKGRWIQAVQHMMKINQMNQAETIVVIQKAFDLWAERNKVKWELDISNIDSLA